MDYCISDIHGYYDTFMRMLEEIKFSDTDKLYILGDYCDRGTQNLKVLDTVRNNKNMICLMGNHDEFLLDYLENEERAFSLGSWFSNGGETTYNELILKSESYKNSIRRFISKLPYYVKYNDNTILCHAGITNDTGRKFSSVDEMLEYFDKDFTWARPYRNSYNNVNLDVKFIVGHTSTVHTFCTNSIERYGNTIFVDCGVVSRKGRLGCLCLDTMQEFYVNRDNF